MQNPRVLVAILAFVAIVGALALWQLTGGTEVPTLPGTGSSTTGTSTADPSAGALNGEVSPARAEQGGPDRQAVPTTDATVGMAALTGLVLDPEGRPMPGVHVHAGPGMSFANANGSLDFDSFDFADFDEVPDFDMARMLRQVKEQLADRVETTTGADGRFRIVAKGKSRGVGLRFLARGHAILDRRVARPTERDLDVGSFTLERGVVVSGRVATTNGAPVAGALVSRVHAMEARMMGGMDFDLPEVAEVEALRGGETAVTDELGRFELRHVAAGELTLRARHADHPTGRSEPRTVQAGLEVGDLLVVVPRGGEIRGVVVGLPDGADAKSLRVMAAKKPAANPAAGPAGMMGMLGGDMAEMLADMGLSIGERTAPIGPDGAFVLRGLTLDTWRVWVSRDGIGFAGNAVCSARVDATPGGASVQLQFDPGISVTFTVVDSKTSKPVERLWVRDVLRGGDRMADLMAAGMPKPPRQAHCPGGKVTLTSLRPKASQKLSITVEALGYAALERKDIELPKTGSLDLGTLSIDPAPTLQVTVTAAVGGRPVPQANVELVRQVNSGPRIPFMNLVNGGSGPARGKTDREGRCTVNRFADGNATLTITADGHAPFVSEPFACTNEGPSTFAAKLFVGGVAEVTVVGPDDKPLAGIAVEHRTPAGATATSKTDANGLTRFEHLTPGAHGFRLGRAAGPLGAFLPNAGGDGTEVPWSNVDVVDLATATLRLTKAASATLRGVVRENGLALVDARVAFRQGPATAPGNDREAAEAMMGEMLGAVGGGGGKRNTKTDERGAYQLSELPEGEHRLYITHKGRAMPTTVPLVLRLGDNGFDVELDMTTVRGVVHDPDGKPVDGARVRVRRNRTGGDPAGDVGEIAEGIVPGMNLGGGSTIRTDATGAFELRGVDPDVEILVSASQKGFSPVSAKIIATRGTTTTLPELRLGAAGKVRVTSTNEQPFGGVRATWKGDGDAVPPVMAMMRRGKATLEGLRPGLWEISIETMNRSGGEAPKRTVEVLAGQTVDVEM